MTLPSKIPILYVVDFLFGYGGTEKHVYELVSKLDRDCFAPMVCCFVGGKVADEIRKLNVTVLEHPLHKVYSLNALKLAIRLACLIRRRRICYFTLGQPKADECFSKFQSSRKRVYDKHA